MTRPTILFLNLSITWHVLTILKPTVFEWQCLVFISWLENLSWSRLVSNIWTQYVFGSWVYFEFAETKLCQVIKSKTNLAVASLWVNNKIIPSHYVNNEPGCGGSFSCGAHPLKCDSGLWWQGKIGAASSRIVNGVW